MLISILHLIQDTDDPYQLVRQLVSALAPDSYVLISHAASDIGNGGMVSMASRLNELMAQPIVPHSRRQVARFFAGLDLVEPGLVREPEWRPALAIDAATPPRCGAASRSSRHARTALVARTARTALVARGDPDGPGRARGDVGQAAAEPGAFGRRQHVSELAERGGKLAMEGDRRVAPGRRERDRQRAPVAGDGRPGDQAAAFGPVGQPGERRLLDAEQGGQLRHAPRPAGQHAQQPGLRGW